VSWPCYMVEQHPNGFVFRMPGNPAWSLQWDDLKPGAMWFDYRFQEPGDVPRLTCKLPSNVEWLIDSRSWKRTGEPPNVTVTPSINHQGQYHGHLTDGVLTDDTEGRKFA